MTADDPLAEPRTDDEAFRRAIQKMSWHNHLQGRDRRPSEYYPDTRLPKVPSGETVCILGLVTAVSGGGKTTVIGYYAAKVIKAGGRIVYFPGEGGLGLDTKRIPAWQSAYGLTDKQMLAQWRTSDRIPNVRETAEIEAAIFHHAEWLRETGGLAVFDTLKTATPGVAENESVMGDLLAGGGQFRKFGDAAGCTVLVAHHLGKDETRGSRGHSSIEGNSDFVHEVDWTKEARKLELKYRKDRDGEDGFSSYFATNGGGGDLGVPTIKKVDFQTFRALNSNDHDIIRHRVSAALTELFTGNERQDPVSTQVLAMAIRKQDIEREMKRAEDRNENYVRPDEKGEAAAVKRIQDNILNEHSKPADGKRAVLFHFVEKDADGNMALVSRQARRWRPAPAADDEQLPTGIAEQVAENDA